MKKLDTLKIDWAKELKDLKVDTKSKLKNLLRLDWTKKSKERKDDFNKKVDQLIGKLEAFTEYYNDCIDNPKIENFNKLYEKYSSDDGFAKVNAIYNKVKKISDSVEKDIATYKKSLTEYEKIFERNRSNLDKKLYQENVIENSEVVKEFIPKEVSKEIINDINKNKAALNSNITKCRAELKKQLEELSNLATQIDKLKEEKDKCDREIAAIKKESEALRKKGYNDISDSESMTEKKKENSKKEVDKAVENFEKLKKIGSLIDSSKSLEEKINNARASMEKTMNNIETIKHKLSEYATTITEYSQGLLTNNESLGKSIMEINEELEKIYARYQDTFITKSSGSFAMKLDNFITIKNEVLSYGKLVNEFKEIVEASRKYIGTDIPSKLKKIQKDNYSGRIDKGFFVFLSKKENLVCDLLQKVEKHSKKLAATQKKLTEKVDKMEGFLKRFESSTKDIINENFWKNIFFDLKDYQTFIQNWSRELQEKFKEFNEELKKQSSTYLLKPIYDKDGLLESAALSRIKL